MGIIGFSMELEKDSGTINHYDKDRKEKGWSSIDTLLHYDNNQRKTGYSQDTVLGGYVHYNQEGVQFARSSLAPCGGFLHYDENGKPVTSGGYFHYDVDGNPLGFSAFVYPGIVVHFDLQENSTEQRSIYGSIGSFKLGSLLTQILYVLGQDSDYDSAVRSIYTNWQYEKFLGIQSRGKS